MRKALILLTFLCGCGVDGAPEAPMAPGMTVTGTIEAGIATEGN